MLGQSGEASPDAAGDCLRNRAERADKSAVTCQLSPDLVLAIRQQVAGGVAAREIAVAHGVGLSTVYAVITKRTHISVGGPTRPTRARLPPQASLAVVRREVRARMLKSIFIAADGCWLWPATSGVGYRETLRVDGRNLPVARLAFELLVGPVNEGMRLHRLCRRAEPGLPVQPPSPCLRPDHLRVHRPGQSLDLRLHGGGARSSCPNGHPYDHENTQFKLTAAGSVTRACRACDRGRKIASSRRRTRQLGGTPGPLTAVCLDFPPTLRP